MTLNKARIKTWIIIAIVFIIGITLSKHDNSVKALDNSTNISIVPTTLDIWDSCSGSANVSENVYFYANYSSINGTIEGRSCSIFLGDIQSDMIINNSISLFNSVFTTSGNYSYTINCSREGYESQAKDSVIQIIDPDANSNQNETNTSNGPIDQDNDGYTNDTDCNENDPNINPGRQEVLYNSIDDDCNPSTLDYVIFDITTNKQSYAPQETVRIYISGINGSDTYLTINTPTNISYVYIFTNGTYPATQEFSLTGLAGAYSVEGVNYYGDYTNAKTANFGIQKTMNAEIQVNRDSAYEGDNLHFKAVISGAVGNSSMIWKMDDTKERYLPEFDYNYSNAREYNVVLMATDLGGNQVILTKKITINKQYLLRIQVVDNSTGSLLGNSTVRVNSVSKEVNSTAEAEFKVTNDTYNIKAFADDYYSYDDDVKINNSLIFTIRLIKNMAIYPPAITLISPENKSVSDKPEFKFKFADDTTANCTLYISDGNGWWTEYNTSNNLQPNTEYTFTGDFMNNTYSWKVLCEDPNNNIGYSPEYVATFLATSPETIGITPDQNYSAVQDVYNAIPDFSTYSPDEKKIAEYLKMDTLINDAKRKLEMANRDLFNLRYQPDSESVIKARDEIYARIESIKSETPLSLRLVEKADFVKYLEDSEVVDLFNEYFTFNNLELSNGEKNKLIEQNKLLQKKTTIQTTAYNVEITYISGVSEEITLITRNIEFDGPADNIMIVEFIPEDIITSSQEITFLENPVNTWKENSIFEYQLSKYRDIQYYLKGTIALDQIPQIKTGLFTSEPNSAALKGITGNVALGSGILNKLGFSDSNKNIFIGELLVVFILLGVYIFYSKSSKPTIVLPKIKQNIESKKFNTIQISPTQTYKHDAKLHDQNKLGYITSVINKSKNFLNTGNLKEAALGYYEAKFLYELLPENSREMLFEEIISLSDQICYKNIIKLADEAVISLAKGENNEAFRLYDEIQEEFNKLSDEYKEIIYSRCCEIALHLDKIK